MKLFISQNLSWMFHCSKYTVCVIGTGGFLGDTMSATLPLPICVPMFNNNVEGLIILEHLHHWAHGWLMNWWCGNTLIGLQSILIYTFYLVPRVSVNPQIHIQFWRRQTCSLWTPPEKEPSYCGIKADWIPPHKQIHSYDALDWQE